MAINLGLKRGKKRSTLTFYEESVKPVKTGAKLRLRGGPLR